MDHHGPERRRPVPRKSRVYGLTLVFLHRLHHGFDVRVVDFPQGQRMGAVPVDGAGHLDHVVRLQEIQGVPVPHIDDVHISRVVVQVVNQVHRHLRIPVAAPLI